MTPLVPSPRRRWMRSFATWALAFHDLPLIPRAIRIADALPSSADAAAVASK